MEDDSFLDEDEFRAYMKHYLFHSLKHSKLKSITEPTHVIKCHSVSPKAPNLKNLTTFSHYIDRLASGDTIGIPKLMSKDVKDIVECLGISPHCEESIEARQKYMQSEDEEPLIFCIISTLVNSINRYTKCKSSYDNMRIKESYGRTSPQISLSRPWQKQVYELLDRYNMEHSHMIQLVNHLTEIMDRELDMIARETTTESHEKEKQLEKYKEMLSRNLEEAERHLLEQKQSLEKQLMKKQIELQDIAQTLSRKKSHISEAVTILQKQKDVLIQKEKEFNTKVSAQSQQLEIKSCQLQAREKQLDEKYDKLNRFHEEILVKLCANKQLLRTGEHNTEATKQVHESIHTNKPRESNNEKTKDSEALVLLLKTVQVQSETLRKFLEKPEETNKYNNGDVDRNQLKNTLETSDIGKKYNCPPPLPGINDENTICDRCGSEVILKFHINENKQKRSDKLYKMKNGNMCRDNIEEDEDIQMKNHKDMQVQHERMATKQSRRDITSHYNTNYAPLPSKDAGSNIHSDDKEQDPVSLSHETLARLTSQLSVLDESFDKYQDNLRNENCRLGVDHNFSSRLLMKNKCDASNPINTGLHQAENSSPPQTHPTVSGSRIAMNSPNHNNRTKHQGLPPHYFTSNVPFWQSYLKTYYVPSNQEKTWHWQDYFQNFTRLVENDIIHQSLQETRNQMSYKVSTESNKHVEHKPCSSTSQADNSMEITSTSQTKQCIEPIQNGRNNNNQQHLQDNKTRFAERNRNNINVDSSEFSNISLDGESKQVETLGLDDEPKAKKCNVLSSKYTEDTTTQEPEENQLEIFDEVNHSSNKLNIDMRTIQNNTTPELNIDLNSTEDNDNLIMEYNAGRSLLFQIQDSDEIRRTPNKSSKIFPTTQLDTCGSSTLNKTYINGTQLTPLGEIKIIPVPTLKSSDYNLILKSHQISSDQDSNSELSVHMINQHDQW
ncbi:hypothetical protein M8J75_001381 [Diaphorina citri]|nr:hypothetical protein M8J75_001381 [Diaphorina citri]